MTGEEARHALFRKTPVIYNGIEYLCITAIIYKCDENNELYVSAELLDKNKRSVIIAKLKDVTTHDNQNQRTDFVS